MGFLRASLPPGFRKTFTAVASNRHLGALATRLFRHGIPSGKARFDPAPAHLNPRLAGLILIKSYEGPEIHLIDRYLRADLDVLELGSSIGLTSAHIARKLLPHRALVCVEPNPALTASITRNVLLNGPATKLRVVQAAVFDRDAPAVPFEIGGQEWVSRIGMGPHSTTVPGRSLDSLIREYMGGDFVLVSDIEGAEQFFILDSPGRELGACRQMMIELHDSYLGERRVGVEEMAAALTARHGFEAVARIRNVLLLERPRGAYSRARGPDWRSTARSVPVR